MTLISVVTPVFNEEGNIAPFVEEVSKALGETACDWEIIFVADPCTDGTEAVIRGLALTDSRLKFIQLTRRFGQPTATLAGLDFARGDAVVVMDVDLQDPPSVIPDMVSLWQRGSQIVVAQRLSREGEPAIKKAVARSGYAFLGRFSEVPIPENTGDFRLMSRQVVDQVRSLPEAHGFLRGLVALVGYDPAVVYFDRPARRSGSTKYNKWIGSLRIGFNGVVGFSTALLSLATIVGLTTAGLALITALGYLAAKLAGSDFPIGNPTVVILILLIGGMILVCLGILGLYIGRIYDEVKRRPRYFIADSINLN